MGTLVHMPARSAQFSQKCSLTVLDKRRQAMLWGIRNRRWMELQVFLGGFAERHLHTLNEEQVQLFSEVLDRKDAELFHWLSGSRPVPADMLQNEVMVMLLQYINQDHPALKFGASSTLMYGWNGHE